MPVRKGTVLLATATLFAVAAQACLPSPDDPVEFLQRPESIVIQLRESDRTELPEEAEQLLAVPDFTLYGDGTLLFKAGGDDSTPLLEARLTEGAIRDLLESISDSGFFDGLPYEFGDAGADATFVYANAKTVANSVKAPRLDDAGAAGLEEGERKEVERVQEIRELLLRPDLSDPARAFEPDAVLLVVRRLAEAEGAGTPEVWPVASVDLASIAPAGAGFADRVIEDESARDVAAALPPGEPTLTTFLQGDLLFAVGYRPLLPFEENFPEFDTPHFMP